MKIALEANNAIDFSRLAHNFKGVSANFSAGPLTRLSADLEALGRQDDLATAPELLTRLDIEAQHLVKYLKEAGII
jgi:HPt (histidine-containing phosphotransfer) domain-containing protein